MLALKLASIPIPRAKSDSDCGPFWATRLAFARP